MRKIKTRGAARSQSRTKPEVYLSSSLPGPAPIYPPSMKAPPWMYTITGSLGLEDADGSWIIYIIEKISNHSD